MNTLLFFDSETNGTPDWHNPSDGEQQPHIVQLAAVQVNADTRETIQSMDMIVRPDGWEIPQEVVDIHGIDAKYATAVGLPEKLVLETFLKLWSGQPRVGHSESFDMRIIRIAIKRYVGDVEADRWKEKKGFCTGWAARPVLGIKGRKMPKLADAYEALVGGTFEGAHTAMGDVKATMALYWALVDGGHIEPFTGAEET